MLRRQSKTNERFSSTGTMVHPHGTLVVPVGTGDNMAAPEEALSADETQQLLHVVLALAERQEVITRILGLVQRQLDRLNTYSTANDELAYAVEQYLKSIEPRTAGRPD